MFRFFLQLVLIFFLNINTIYSQCSINIGSPTKTLCTGANSNTYNISGQITFANAPVTGTLIISVEGGHSKIYNAPFSSPHNYTLDKLIADGANRGITAYFSANISCTSSITFTAPNPVGTGFSSFPLNTVVTNFLWGSNPYPQQSWDGGYLPFYGGPYSYGGGIHDLDLSPPGVTNIAALCAELAEGVAGGAGSNYTNTYQYIALEKITRGTAGQNDESQNIPSGGIGKVRAGI